MSNARGRRWVWRYTLGQMLCHLVWLGCMALSGRGLLWHTDSLLQQYTTLRYTAEAVRGLFQGKGLNLVDLSLGQGLDTLGALGFYGLTNPLYWLAALLKGRQIEYYYYFLVFLYSWLSGFAFGLFAAKTRVARGEGWAVAAGALMFALCGYNTAGLLKCPYFAAGGIFLCLILWGVERCLQDKKWLALCLLTFLSILVNFYHAYQTLLMAAAYVLLRLLCRAGRRGLGGTVRDGLRTAGACVAGLLLSGFMLLPTLGLFLTSARSGAAAGYTASLYRYPLDYYKQLAACMFAPYSQAGHWTQLAFLPWAAAGLLALFTGGNQRRHWWLRAGFLLALAGICVPLAGKVLNGFSYVTNRWSYGFALALCLCATAGLRDLFTKGFRHRKLAAALIALWAAAMVALAGSGVDETFRVKALGGIPMNIVTVVVGAALLLCVAGTVFYYDRCRQSRRSRRRAVRFVSVTMALCALVYTAGYGLLMLGGNTFMKRDLDRRILRHTPARATAASAEFARVDAGGGPDAYAALLGYHGTNYYWSIIPDSVSDYYADLQLPGLRWVFRMDGLGGDPYLCAAAGVGTAARKMAGYNIDLPPYGFEPVGAGLWKNRYALPLGVFYEDTLSESEYRKLSPLEKREALLTAAVLADGEGKRPELSAGETVPVTLSAANGRVTVGENSFKGKKGGVVDVSCDIPDGSLGWLWFRGAKLTSCKNSTYLMLRGLDVFGRRSRVYFPNPEGNYYYDREGAFLYLGEGKNSLRLTLGCAAELEWDALELVTLPAQDYVSRTEALRSRGGWSPRVSANRLAGSYTAPGNGVLQIAIPFLPGWRASVDGRPATLERCGGMYTGLRLTPGRHDILLTYETPLLRYGVALTAAGLLAVLIALIAGRRRRARI